MSAPGAVAGRASRAFLLVALVGLVSLGVYLATLAPGLTWAHDSADGGELAAAAHTLGIAHPPGYPTYLLLAHPLTLLPLGEVATRTNLFSALCATGVTVLLTWSLVRMRHVWTSAVTAGLALAFAPLLWSQAVVTEVHALNALFAALLLVFAVGVQPTAERPARRSAWLALATGLAWGVSLGNHPTAFLCVPLVCLVLWRLGRWGLFVLLGLALGLCVYLYLPLRAAADPPLNWGDPETLGRFWRVVSGRLYQSFVFALPWGYLGRRLLAWSGLVAAQFTALGLLFAGLGAAALWAKDRVFFVTTAVTVTLCSVFAVGYDTADSYLYLLPALVCMAFWLGLGVEWVLAALRARWPRWLPAAYALFLVLPLIAAIVRFPGMDLSDDREAREWAGVTLKRAPPRAVLLTEQDAHTFSLWYLQYALGQRPDVVVVDLDLLAYDWYTAQLSQHLPPEVLFSLRVRADAGQTAEALGRPVCRAGVAQLDLACQKP